jgi:trans-aconitate 2-methyltransferase
MSLPAALRVREAEPAPAADARDWNPSLYLKFESERTRAARDLLARVRLDAPKRVVDLGCGPGNSTELLRRRFPGAAIVGLDTSHAMLARARSRVPDARFVREDIAAWTPEAPADLIFANAALHFLPDHDRLLARLMGALAPGGVLALQMPDIEREASHVLMRMIAADGPWAERLVPVAKTRPLLAAAETYWAWLDPMSSELDVWQTTYLHPLESAQGVVDWFAGSALRPFLARLDERERWDFLGRYRNAVKDAYPVLPDGAILLAYPRLFVVARRKTGPAA